MKPSKKEVQVGKWCSRWHRYGFRHEKHHTRYAEMQLLSILSQKHTLIAGPQHAAYTPKPATHPQGRPPVFLAASSHAANIALGDCNPQAAAAS